MKDSITPNERIDYAVKLRVPCSGVPELDDMIRHSRRLDLAGQALSGLLAGTLRNASPLAALSPESIAKGCFIHADALLTEADL